MPLPRGVLSSNDLLFSNGARTQPKSAAASS